MSGIRGAFLVNIFLAGTLWLGGPAQKASAGWVDSGWGYRMSITADANLVQGTEPLVGFSMLVSLNGVDHPNVFLRAKADGSDLLFTAADGITALDREIVSYDAGAQTAEIWVQASVLSKTQNQFFLYYSNPDTTITQPGTAAWKSEYRAVYHFADDPGLGVLTDSSPAGAHAPLDLARWSSSDVTAAKIHQGWTYDGLINHTSTAAISTQDSSYVIGAWLLNTASGTDFFMQTNPGFWHTSSQTASSHRPNYASVIGAASWDPTPIPLNSGYHHFAWAFDGVNDSITFYFDGDPQPLKGMTPGLDTVYTGLPINPTATAQVGIIGPMFPIQDDFMNGAGDEFRVHEGVLTSQWIKTEFNNQDAPLTFFVFGPEDTSTATALGDPSGDQIFAFANHPNPFSHGTSVRFGLGKPGHVRLAVYDVAGREVATLVDETLPAGDFERIWDGRTTGGNRVASGVYFLHLDTGRVRRSLKSLLVR